MKLLTIWTLRGMKLSERFHQTSEWMAINTAAHLPRQVKYWVSVQAIAKTSCLPDFSDQHPLSVTGEDILQNLEKTASR